MVNAVAKIQIRPHVVAVVQCIFFAGLTVFGFQSPALSAETSVTSIDIAMDSAGRTFATFHLPNSRAEMNFRSLLTQRVSRWRQMEGKIGAIEIIPDTQKQDRQYPQLMLLSKALGILNLDYMMPTPTAQVIVRIRNAYDIDKGRCVREMQLKIDGTQDAGRYVVLASSLEDCKNALRTNRGIVVSPGSLPNGLSEYIARSVSIVNAEQARLFQHVAENAPLIVIKHDQASTRLAYQADMGWKGMIFLRLDGNWSSWMEHDLSDRLGPLIAHEVAHLWIGRGLRLPPVDIRGEWDWLPEGAAEYAALITAYRLGMISADTLLTRLSGNIERCANGLGEHALLSSAQPHNGSLVYDCGVVVHLFYDLALGMASNGTRGVFDIWATQLGESSVINTDKFLASSSFARTLLAPLLEGPTLDPAVLFEGLMTMGVTVESSPQPMALVGAVVFPLIRADCTPGQNGFWLQENGIVLDVPQNGCKRLSPGYKLRNIAGVDVIHNPVEMVNAARAACSQVGSEIVVDDGSPDSPPLTLLCGDPIQFPIGMKLRKLPDFLASLTKASEND